MFYIIYKFAMPLQCYKVIVNVFVYSVYQIFYYLLYCFDNLNMKNNQSHCYRYILSF